MGIHPTNRNTTIKLYTRTKVKTALGFTETWTNYVTLWASVLELSSGSGPDDVVLMDSNNSVMTCIKVTLRGRRTFSVADTQIVWKGLTWRVLQSPNYPSRSDTHETIIYCHQSSGM